MIHKKNVITYTGYTLQPEKTSVRTIEFIFEKKYKDLVSALNNSSSTLKDDDKIYFTSHVKFPRIKVREYAKNNNNKVKIKRDINASTKIVVDSKEIINNYLNSNHWSKRLETNIYKVTYQELEYYIITTDHYVEELEKILSNDVFSDVKKQKIKIVYNLSNTERGNLKELLDIKSSEYNKFIDVDTLTSICNNGIKIDAEYYSTLKEMFSSHDTSVGTMGLDVLASCDYVNSNQFYIYMLYLQFSYYWQRHCTNYSNITVKTFINYYKNICSSIYYSNSNEEFILDKIINALGNAVDADNKNILNSVFNNFYIPTEFIMKLKNNKIKNALEYLNKESSGLLNIEINVKNINIEEKFIKYVDKKDVEYKKYMEQTSANYKAPSVMEVDEEE